MSTTSQLDSILNARRNGKRPIDKQAIAFLGTFLHLAFLSLLVLLASLKEQPSFWLYAGGWSIGFRHFVLTTFYPLLFLEFGLLAGYSALVITNSRAEGGPSRQAVACLPILWMIFLAILWIVAANNIENYFTGRPIHWHPA